MSDRRLPGLSQLEEDSRRREEKEASISMADIQLPPLRFDVVHTRKQVSWPCRSSQSSIGLDSFALHQEVNHASTSTRPQGRPGAAPLAHILHADPEPSKSKPGPLTKPAGMFRPSMPSDQAPHMKFGKKEYPGVSHLSEHHAFSLSPPFGLMNVSTPSSGTQHSSSLQPKISAISPALAVPDAIPTELFPMPFRKE